MFNKNSNMGIQIYINSKNINKYIQNRTSIINRMSIKQITTYIF